MKHEIITLRAIAVLCGALLVNLPAGCIQPERDDDEPTPVVDSETHWAQISCRSDNDCSGAQACLCGLCTITCGADAACGSGASCAKPGDSGFDATCAATQPAPQPGICLADCASDNDCGAGLGCQQGSCLPAAPAGPADMSPADMGAGDMGAGEVDMVDMPAPALAAMPPAGPAYEEANIYITGARTFWVPDQGAKVLIDVIAPRDNWENLPRDEVTRRLDLVSWDGVRWAHESLPADSGLVSALDSAGRLVVFAERLDRDVRVLLHQQADGSWSEREMMRPDCVLARHHVVLVDSQDRPRVYSDCARRQDARANGIFRTAPTPSMHGVLYEVEPVVETRYDVSEISEAAIDASDRAHFIFSGPAPNNGATIYHAREKAGSAGSDVETVLSVEQGRLRALAFHLDDVDGLHRLVLEITSSERSERELVLVSRRADGTWSSEAIDALGWRDIKVAEFDALGQPHVVFIGDAPASGVRIASKARGGSWTTRRIVESWGASQWMTLNVDAARPFVVREELGASFSRPDTYGLHVHYVP